MPWNNGQFEEPDNNDRAEWANQALTAYSEATRPAEEVELTLGNEDDKEEFQTRLGDLLCDLRHLADQWGVDYDEANDNGLGNYVEERQEDIGPEVEPANS